MTRETRVALLVGLVFIVLFGLVLGRRSLSLNVGGASRTDGPAPAPAAERVRPSPEMIAARMYDTNDRPVLSPDGSSSALGVGAGTADSTRAASRSRVSPRQAESDLRAAGQPDRPESVRAASRVPAPTQAPAPPTRTYRVRRGDSLIKIARKVYGRGHEKEHSRIYQANRDRLSDPAVLSIGQVLVIPPLPEAQPAAVASESRRYTEMTLEALADRFGGERTYVVRPGDNLSDIARTTMGRASISAVRKIFNANRDRISDPDRLSVGLKLRIPG